jgi:fatty acid desaturase
MPSEALAPAGPTLNSAELLRRVNELRRPDNATNWLYLVREHLFLAGVVGATILFYHKLGPASLSWLWAVPVTLAAIVLIGAGQHRLATLAHEASHYALFRNRTLNELVSDWLCMFPLFSTTHAYRMQHLGHHQYPNDPERDPDVTQMRASGHRFALPMSRSRFLWECVLKQVLWPGHLVRYILVRAAFKVDRQDGGPYRMVRRQHPLLSLAVIAYFVGLIGVLAGLVWQDEPELLLAVPAGMLAGALGLLALAPGLWLAEPGIKPDLPGRLVLALRLSYYTLLATALAWLTWQTGRPWWLFYLVLWVVPLGTSFSFFMILRQVVQHGNADRERLTNTRIFHVSWPISCAVFPLGMDYHLPHHLFPMVPHYRLRRLHALLLEVDAYREQATLVEGYFLPRERPPKHPTVLDLMTHEN